MCTVRVWNLAVTCFNRYMVECEYAKIFDELKAVCVLIDTWWNVNPVAPG